MYLIKKKDIQERIESPFVSVSEGAIDSDNHVVKGVCVFGTRESANKRIYQDKAIESLAKLTNGAKMFLNHPGKSELKEYGGVRRIQDWGGIFQNARKESDKVFADLIVRESYWDLVQDIAMLSPTNVGHSINARVKVFTDDKGMESVVDMDALKSIDLVSSAATTTSLFEATQEKFEQNKEFEILRELIEPRVKDRFQVLLAEEGVIQDKLDNDKLRHEINDVAWLANDLIDRIIYDDKFPVEDKKSKVIAIFDDLDKEVKKRLSKIKESKKQEGDDDEMEITTEMLKKDYPEIVKSLVNESKAKVEFDQVQNEVKVLTESKTALEAQIQEKDKAIQEKEAKVAELEEANKKLATELDEKKVAEAVNAKKAVVEKLLNESKLPKEARTEVFFNQLLAVEEKKDGEKVLTVEEQIKALILDRQKIAAVGKGRVRDMGEEFTPPVDDGKRKTAQEAKDEFLKKIK